ncbi:hypothetical protein CW304_18515 [Bacillus sp. UFRGS-B20]|nr:hypothetical protein CW304_18515 [Bacillus sp. UFRGS-B20]
MKGISNLPDFIHVHSGFTITIYLNHDTFHFPRREYNCASSLAAYALYELTHLILSKLFLTFKLERIYPFYHL